MPKFRKKPVVIDAVPVTAMPSWAINSTNYQIT